MHAEYFRVSRELIQYLAGQKRNITAVGTTSVRTLESLYWLGVKIHENGSLPPEQLWLNQWEAYRLPQHVSTDKSFSSLLQWMEKEYISELVTHTRLMIVPGYTFRSVQSMITNFHQPGSTLLLLVAAFMGDSWKSTYQYALDNSFRFLSYGDSSLLLG
jgi:S-adenosylmethionine:tRNA ribosyltransferase-isomerase